MKNRLHLAREGREQTGRKIYVQINALYFARESREVPGGKCRTFPPAPGGLSPGKGGKGVV
ncbi:hypothetical protein DLM45_15310 [Hyphomicrobium methylovorum]|nr:hypothetical protein [Hyphomicrobium methylovorum]